MTASRSFLNAVAYSIGTPKPIEAMPECDGMSSEALLEYKNRGHLVCCSDERPFGEMCRQSASETLRLANVEATAIDAVLFAKSNASWSAGDELQILGAIRDIGISQKKIIGLQMQNCSGFGSVLDVAMSLSRGGSAPRVLVMLCGNATTERSRFDQNTRTVFGDGAASCLVSGEEHGFEIRATMTRIDTSLATSDLSPSLARSRFRNMRGIVAEAYRQADIGAGDITALLGTNGNSLYFELMAEAAGVPIEKVYREDLATIGHIYSCDNLIALKNYGATAAISAGDNFLVIGWSPYAVSATILQAIN